MPNRRHYAGNYETILSLSNAIKKTSHCFTADGTAIVRLGPVVSATLYPLMDACWYPAAMKRGATLDKIGK